jgi:hypothetical protein
MHMVYTLLLELCLGVSVPEAVRALYPDMLRLPVYSPVLS